MSISIPTRQQLSKAVNELPVEVIPELASFMDYLRFKTGLSPLGTETEQPSAGSTFLHSIVGIGTCDETDLSERDEDILAAEIDSVRGWGLSREDKS